MATNDQHTANSASLTGQQASSSQPGGAVAPGRNQARGIRRRSSTFRRATRNVESFDRNRSHAVRQHHDDIAVLAAHRARTRSVTRVEAMQQHQQSQQQQQQHTSLYADGTLGNLDSPPDNHPEEWKPSIVLGSPLWVEGEDLNAIELANRKVAQTRLWMNHYQGVPHFVQVHQEAVQAREQLDETAEENTTPRSAASTK